MVKKVKKKKKAKAIKKARRNKILKSPPKDNKPSIKESIKERVKKALVELHDENFYIVTLTVIRDRAGVSHEEADDYQLAQIVSEAKEELGISRPSIGGITI